MTCAVASALLLASAAAQTQGQRGEILGAAGFGAQTIDVFNALSRGASLEGEGTNLAEVNKIAKDKFGTTYTEMASSIGRDTRAEAQKLVETVGSRFGGLQSLQSKKWLELFTVEYQKKLERLKALD